MNRFIFIDDLCGSGKTTAAINLMNSNKNDQFIYATPFLSEVDRLVKDTNLRQPDKFYSEKHERGFSKGEILQIMLNDKASIATTHELLKSLVLSKSSLENYTLILDEVLDLCEVYKGMTNNDFKHYLNMGWIVVNPDTSLISRTKQSSFAPDKYKEELTFLDSHCLYRFDDKVIILQLPLDVLSRFKQVIVMSYMVKGSWLYQMLAKDNQITMMMVQPDVICFIDWDADIANQKAKNAYKLIEMFVPSNGSRDEYKKITDVCSLSHSATSKLSKGKVSSLGIVVKKILQRKANVNVSEVMLSSFDNRIKVPSFDKSYVPFNSRATNNYADKTMLVYLISRHQNPILEQWNDKHNGIEMDDNHYSLDCLIQWVFRSAVRNGHPVRLFLPSLKMRKLLSEWGSGYFFKEDK